MCLIQEILDIHVLHAQKADTTVIATTELWFHRLCKATKCPLIRIPNNNKNILLTWGQAESFQNKRWKLHACEDLNWSGKRRLEQVLLSFFGIKHDTHRNGYHPTQILDWTQWLFFGITLTKLRGGVMQVQT